MRVSSKAMRLLCAYSWPGNVREIQNLTERLVVTVDDDVIEVTHLPPDVRAAEWRTADETAAEDGDAFPTLAENERHHLVRALEASGGVVRGERGAAALLGVPESTLRYRLKKHGLSRGRD